VAACIEAVDECGDGKLEAWSREAEFGPALDGRCRQLRPNFVLRIYFTTIRKIRKICSFHTGHVFGISPWTCFSGYLKESFKGCVYWAELCVSSPTNH
jgi:hypothetical protein